jgi:hypothetical protein
VDAIILLVGQAFLEMKCINPINANIKALLWLLTTDKINMRKRTLIGNWRS